MRTALSALALFVTFAALTGCAADASSDAEATDSTDDALIEGMPQTTSYRGSFTVEGKTYRVALDITLPRVSAGYQQADAHLRHVDAEPRPFCRVFNEFIPGTASLRVTGPNGEVVAENSARSGTNGYLGLDASDCPGGILASRRAYSELPARVSTTGAGFEVGGKEVHVPRGYFSPSDAIVDATSTFQARSASTFTRETNSAFHESKLETNGLIRVHLPRETSIEIGIGPAIRGHLGYEQVVDVTLRAN